MNSRTARLFVVSGPSGVGKGTIVSRVREKLPNLGLTVSATTRPPRENEVEGSSYFFLSEEEFDELLEKDGFLEWANVFNHRYGTLRSEVERNLSEGNSVILEIDVQGGLHVRERSEDAVLIFIDAPSLEELERRLRGRGTDSEESIQVRLSKVSYERELGELYDCRIVNDVLDRAVDELCSIIWSYERNERHTQDVCN